MLDKMLDEEEDWFSSATMVVMIAGAYVAN